MANQNEYAELEWRDGRVPVARRFDDPYYSLENGVAETAHVFLAGNDLPERFRPGFHIAELGFGSGLNLLCAWQAWLDAGVEGPLRFTSFEAYPMAPADRVQAHGAWPELAARAAAFAEIWDEARGVARCSTLELQVLGGDARQSLPAWDGAADAWFLDGFSPARNPELWGEALMAEVARHTAPGGSFATYSAAGHVRQALAEAGFAVTRCPGFGRKRHMSRGVLAPA